MPCGGIYSLDRHFAAEYLTPAGAIPEAKIACIVCEMPVTLTDLFCDEWDCYLHYRCLGAFLASEEGQCVLQHGHEIVISEQPEVKQT